MIAIGEKIRDLRKINRLTQDLLAKKMGVKQQQIQIWETGKRNPSLKALIRIVKVFNISLDALVLNEKELSNLKFKDKTAVEKLKKLEKLKEPDKQAVLTLIESLAEKNEKII